MIINKAEKEWWVAWLEARFGGRDFSVLNKEWKQKYYEDCANEILLAMNLVNMGGKLRIK